MRKDLIVHTPERAWLEHPKESHDTTQELKFIKIFQVLEWSFYQNLKANKDRWENLADIIIKYFQNSLIDFGLKLQEIIYTILDC